MKAFALLGVAAVASSACRSARMEKADKDGGENWSVSEGAGDTRLVLSGVQREMVSQNNGFAFNLFRKTMGMDSRVVSPLSVTYLMGMLANGAHLR